MNISKSHSDIHLYDITILLPSLESIKIMFYYKLEQGLPKHGQISSSPQTRKKKVKTDTVILSSTLYINHFCSLVLINFSNFDGP